MRSDPLYSYHALAVFLEIFSVHQQLYFALLKALSKLFLFLFFRLPIARFHLAPESKPYASCSSVIALSTSAFVSVAFLLGS